MNAKALINFKKGTVELLGSEEFITKYLDDIRKNLTIINNQTNNSPNTELEFDNRNVDVENPVKPKRQVGPKKIEAIHSEPDNDDTHFIQVFKNKKLKPDKSEKTKSKPTNQFPIEEGEFIPALHDFLVNKGALEHTTRFITAIGYYLTKLRGAAYFTPGNIEFAYSAFSITSKPKNVGNIFQNIKTKNGLIESIERGQWRLTVSGEKFVEFLPKVIRKKEKTAI
jgi:hypothetical protein